MYLKKLRSKNFLSSGEQAVELQLDRHSLTMIHSKNGSGKTSLTSDALSFVLFNKPIRKVKKDHLVNTKNNKGTLVECELTGNNNKEVLVRRGIKPEIFEIWENGVLVDQSAASRDYQLYLETNILGMNFDTFTKIVIISKTLYTPFMQLKAAERRSFVESVLGLTVFGTMLKVQTKVLTTLKQSETVLHRSIELGNNTILNKAQSLKTIKQLAENAKLNEQEKINADIQSLEFEITNSEDSVVQLNSTLHMLDNSVVLKSDKLKTNQVRLRNEIAQLVTNISKLENSDSKCGACGTMLDDTNRLEHIELEKIKLLEKQTLSEKVTHTIDSLVESVNDYSVQVQFNNTVTDEIKAHKTTILNLNRQISNLKNTVTDYSVYDKEIDDLKNEIKSLKVTHKENESNYQTLASDIEKNTIALSFLKDTGIKANIIAESIPLINKIINQYLHKFGFFIDFKLDSEFNETITIRGNNKLTYFSYSEGEKLRMDIAVMLAWREIALVKNNSTCNVLMLDEIGDSSLDFEGAEIMGKIIVELDKVNAFIISHTPEKLENIVRSVIEFEKIDGFTRIKPN